jgi:hypothetical protein
VPSSSGASSQDGVADPVDEACANLQKAGNIYRSTARHQHLVKTVFVKSSNVSAQPQGSEPQIQKLKTPRVHLLVISNVTLPNFAPTPVIYTTLSGALLGPANVRW